MRKKHTKESLYSMIEKDEISGCWNYTGSLDRAGYGSIGRNGTSIGAHRLSWILTHGEINNSKILVCHHCDNPKCINPDHLFIGTHRDNLNDMVSKKRHPYIGNRTVKETCKRGHPTADNRREYIIKDGTVKRICKACVNEQRVECYNRKKLEFELRKIEYGQFRVFTP